MNHLICAKLTILVGGCLMAALFAMSAMDVALKIMM